MKTMLIKELSLSEVEDSLCLHFELGIPQSSNINIDDIKPNTSIRDITISGINGSKSTRSLRISDKTDGSYLLTIYE